MNLQENISRIKQIMESDSTKVKSILYPIFEKTFNQYTISVDEDGYVRWLKEDIEDPEEDMPFHKNSWGRLWVEDCDAYKKLLSHARLLAMEEKELKSYLIDYLNQRYESEFSITNPIKAMGDDNCEDF